MTSVPAGLFNTREHVGDPLITASGVDIFKIYCRDYAIMSLQIGAKLGEALPGAGQITLEGSNDNVNWVAVPYILTSGALTTTGVLGLTAATMVYIATPFIWLRARVSTLITTPPVSPYVVLLFDDQAIATIFASALNQTVTVSGTITANLAASSVIALNALAAAGGAAVTRLSGVSAATGVVKASAGRRYGLSLMNTQAAIRYVHFYNKTTAPTIATDTPVETIAIAANGRVDLSCDTGISFATGISYGVTTDNIAVPAAVGAAGDVVGTIYSF